MNQRKTIELEEGWDFMQNGITKLKRILEGLPEPQFSSEEYMMLYTYPLSTNYFLTLHFLTKEKKMENNKRKEEQERIRV